MNVKNAGEMLKMLRGNRTREEIAYKTNISVAALTVYETGRRLPKDEIKVRLADFYGVTVQELFFSDQKEKDIQS